MKKMLCLSLLLCLLHGAMKAQQVVNKEIPGSKLIPLADDIQIPEIGAGYTLWLPRAPALGMIVMMHSRRDTTKKDKLIDHALSQNLAVLYLSTHNQVEFLFEVEKMLELEEYIAEVIADYQIPKSQLLFAGMSLAGTRALKMAHFAQSAASKQNIAPKAIAICDAPLDMVRFYHSMKRAKELNFQAVAANEGKWVSSYLYHKLGGSPQDKLKAYVDYSPYCQIAKNGGTAVKSLAHMYLRAYTEPDVQWWMETRRKNYYDMNAVDMAALVNQLNINGNNRAQLIITQDQGFLADGRRHPHSWSIVDEKELVDWFVSVLDK